VVNVKGNQEGTAKSYNSKKPGDRCYNLQLAFCDEIKTYLTGYVRSGDTYMANSTAEMIKEIIAQLKDEGLEITFRMDNGYFGDAILEGKEYDYIFFVTITEQSSEEVVEFYEKCVNCEKSIKEAKYDMAVGHLLLQSF
jgi:hypothetical protein